MKHSTGQSRWTARAARLACALALSACIVAPAHAELWGYVDGDGVAHFADTRLDARYTLFMRDGGHLDSADLGHRGAITLQGKSSPSAKSCSATC